MLKVIDVLHRDLPEKEMNELWNMNKMERQLMAGNIADELRQKRWSGLERHEQDRLIKELDEIAKVDQPLEPVPEENSKAEDASSSEIPSSVSSDTVSSEPISSSSEEKKSELKSSSNSSTEEYEPDLSPEGQR